MASKPTLGLALVVLALVAAGLGGAPVQAAACARNPTVLNSLPWLTNPPYAPGTALMARCKSGYTSVPAPVATCTAAGSWSYTQNGQCSPVCAGGPTAPATGLPGNAWPASCTNATVRSTYCRATCDASVNLYGLVSQYCSSAGFTTALGRCQLDGACSTLPSVTVQNGRWTADAIGTAAGAKASVTCNPNYGSAPNPTTLDCIYDPASSTRGRWATSVTGPGCKRIIINAVDNAKGPAFISSQGYALVNVPETAERDGIYLTALPTARPAAACFQANPDPKVEFNTQVQASTVGESWGNVPWPADITRVYFSGHTNDPLTITLPPGTTAFGIRMQGNNYGTYEFTATARDATGTAYAPLTQSTASSDDSSTDNPAFFGFALQPGAPVGAWIDSITYGPTNSDTDGNVVGGLMIACNRI